MSKQKSFIKSYLQKCQEKIENFELTICIGTEACDPDSFACSIILGIHENAIPVINLNRKIFEAKEDLMHICSEFGISPSDLIFLERPKGKFSLDERKLGSLFRTCQGQYKIADKSIKMILVDHHIPVEELKHFTIDTIIDHHALNGLTLPARRIYIDTDVGSCCTLVSKFIGHSLNSKKYHKNEMFENSQFCMEMAKMLAIPILLDTNKFKKVTSHFDQGEFKRLLKISQIPEKNIKKIVKTIKKVRKSEKDIQTDIILQLDFKKFEIKGKVFGYSTVKYSFKKWIDREAKACISIPENKSGQILKLQFESFIQENGLDFLLINSKCGSRRFLAFVNCPIERQLTENLNFSPLNYKGMCYYEIPLEKTRKILAPVILKMLETQ